MTDQDPDVTAGGMREAHRRRATYREPQWLRDDGEEPGGSLRVPDAVAARGLEDTSFALLMWDADVEGFVWGNAAGLASWGALGPGSLMASRLDRAMPAMRQLHDLARAALPADGIRQALTFWTPRGAQRLDCQCLPADLGDGGHGVLLMFRSTANGMSDQGTNHRAQPHARYHAEPAPEGRVRRTTPVAGFLNGAASNFSPQQVSAGNADAGTSRAGTAGVVNGAAAPGPRANGAAHAPQPEEWDPIVDPATARQPRGQPLPRPDDDDRYAMSEIARMLGAPDASRASGSRGKPNGSMAPSMLEGLVARADPLPANVELANAKDQGATFEDEMSEDARPEHARPGDARSGRDARVSSADIDRLHHELRTPLNSIIGFAEMMDHGLFGPLGDPRYEGYARNILRSARDALELINDLLEAARVRAGHVAPQLEPTDVSAMVARVVTQLEPQIGDADVRVVTGLPDDLAPVLVDPRALRQILVNLLTNALKFTGAGGHVFLSARAGPADDDAMRDTILIEVRDTGVGMTKAEIAEAMRPWERGSPVEANADGESTNEGSQTDVGLTDRSQTDRTRRGQSFEGTGLGLPLVRELVEAQGGQFSLSSRVGEGTCARIALRRASAPHQPGEPRDVETEVPAGPSS
ncbi:MAG: ATP-binding protein [Pseudomonadota bacterium]